MRPALKLALQRFDVFYAFKPSSDSVSGTASKEKADGRNAKVGYGSRATKNSIPAKERQSGGCQEEGSSSGSEDCSQGSAGPHLSCLSDADARPKDL
ncbi:hypothetical protein UPYG_G00339870 [Umbra pygmaea]|uniref:Uncharacterized protein n=1 Tax=Umbra pygmaea TaxID=75934 RepID=A0ABD0VWI9_UMBPY